MGMGESFHSFNKYLPSSPCLPGSGVGLGVELGNNWKWPFSQCRVFCGRTDSTQVNK